MSRAFTGSEDVDREGAIASASHASIGFRNVAFDIWEFFFVDVRLRFFVAAMIAP
jgi:hypothetical protein